MKGLLKGLRYISEIFEADNVKEPEIQIGAPTDVKHVAHIGCDGPSSNAPSWMNEFQGSSDAGSSKESTGTPNRHGKSKQSNTDTRSRKSKTSTSDNETSRARRNKNTTAGAESPSQDAGAKKNRKKKRATNRDSSASNNSYDSKSGEM
ncbi:ROP-interactive CRIB motif-containing protein B [Artemisia annua]|uniref:ROP-interactive CRIB motif-containing protein B n=1 Tax=Artemisia annua TaxID=35608 RepID=A0A2U1PZE7_ARTAN|nr:ROP-interactive CRIB motif-containing protein B [Artemisia annua]